MEAFGGSKGNVYGTVHTSVLVSASSILWHFIRLAWLHPAPSPSRRGRLIGTCEHRVWNDDDDRNFKKGTQGPSTSKKNNFKKKKVLLNIFKIIIIHIKKEKVPVMGLSKNEFKSAEASGDRGRKC